MWSFLRRQFTYGLVGFVIAFIIYLFIQFDTSEVVNGLLISLAAGIVLMVVLFFLERRFPERERDTPRR